MIERAKEEDTTWEGYESWIVRDENADKLSSSKELEVEGGYYYRVSCIHSANDDVTDSFTDGVFIEKADHAAAEKIPDSTAARIQY